MVGLVAIVLSLFAGSCFRKATMTAQISSLLRVIEVASQEILRKVSAYTFDLGMKLGRSEQLTQALKHADHDRLVTSLDDPFINGFVMISSINLVKLRVFNLNLELISESSAGIEGLAQRLPEYDEFSSLYAL